MNDSGLRFLAPDNPELIRAWEQLDESDPVRECDCCGEVWQYMGTVRDQHRRWVHQFRHRHLNGERVYRNIRASLYWCQVEGSEEGRKRAAEEVARLTVAAALRN